jgi:hypothetical protein
MQAVGIAGLTFQNVVLFVKDLLASSSHLNVTASDCSKYLLWVWFIVPGKCHVLQCYVSVISPSCDPQVSVPHVELFVG